MGNACMNLAGQTRLGSGQMAKRSRHLTDSDGDIDMDVDVLDRRHLSGATNKKEGDAGKIDGMRRRGMFPLRMQALTLLVGPPADFLGSGSVPIQ